MPRSNKIKIVRSHVGGREDQSPVTTSATTASDYESSDAHHIMARGNGDHDQQQQVSASDEATPFYEEEDEDMNASTEMQDREFTFNTLSSLSTSGDLPVSSSTTSSGDNEAGGDLVTFTPASSTSTSPSSANKQLQLQQSVQNRQSLSDGKSKFEICCVCNNDIKTTKSGSYRSDNFLEEYKSCFPGFSMVCGPVCYTCYYTCYQFRKKKRESGGGAGDEVKVKPRKRASTAAIRDSEADFEVNREPRKSRRNKRKAITSDDASVVDEDVQAEVIRPGKRRKKNAAEVREFQCVCCNKNEIDNQVYSYKNLADAYNVLFPGYTEEDGDVCKNCHYLAYRYTLWRSENPTADPAMFLEAENESEQEMDPNMPVSHRSNISNATTQYFSENTRRRKFNRTKKESSDSNGELEVPTFKPSSQAYESMKAKASGNLMQVAKSIEEIVEVFYDYRLKEKDDKEYKQSKIIRDMIESKSTKDMVMESSQKYLPYLLTKPARTISHADENVSASTASEAETNGETKETLTVESNEPSNQDKFVIADVKLAEKDSTGQVIEVDMVQHQLQPSVDRIVNQQGIKSTLKPRSRFVVYVDHIEC